jgi:malonyl-CoA decarboxylase
MRARHLRPLPPHGEPDAATLSWPALFRQVARAPRGLRALLDMRARLLRALPQHPEWAAVEADLTAQLRFVLSSESLELRRITGDTAPEILDRIVHYEAVHAMADRSELMRRLQRDRRCFALFHPAMPEEPLIFTEVALTAEMAAHVQPILDPASPVVDPATCTCAMFYSISSCHEGLRGIAFGNLLIRRVVDRLRTEFPRIDTFATVSPVPGFRGWLAATARDTGRPDLQTLVAALEAFSWRADARQPGALTDALLSLAAVYLLQAKRGEEPADSVARFHLGNGARLERINWAGDISASGVARSFGLTANYVYALSDIDRNHEAYASARTVVVSDTVRSRAAVAGLDQKSTSTFIAPSSLSR